MAVACSDGRIRVFQIRNFKDVVPIGKLKLFIKFFVELKMMRNFVSKFILPLNHRKDV